MGMFTKTQEDAAQRVYQDMRQFLRPRDGMLHVVMVNSFSKFANQNFQCEDKYTTQIDSILYYMQCEGYQIVDIKFNSIQGQGITGSMEGFNTLIMYR